MRIIEAKDYADMSRKAAHILAAQVTLKPEEGSCPLDWSYRHPLPDLDAGNDTQVLCKISNVFLSTELCL